jgi:hypothetical protein
MSKGYERWHCVDRDIGPRLSEATIAGPDELPMAIGMGLTFVRDRARTARNGGGRIRTCEGRANAFTARPL